MNDGIKCQLIYGYFLLFMFSSFAALGVYNAIYDVAILSTFTWCVLIGWMAVGGGLGVVLVGDALKRMD